MRETTENAEPDTGTDVDSSANILGFADQKLSTAENWSFEDVTFMNLQSKNEDVEEAAKLLDDYARQLRQRHKDEKTLRGDKDPLAKGYLSWAVCAENCAAIIRSGSVPTLPTPNYATVSNRHDR